MKFSSSFRTVTSGRACFCLYQLTLILGVFPPRRGMPLAAHGNAVGLIRFKTLSPAGAPHEDATLSEGPGMLGGPFRADSFLGTVFPWRCHGLEEKCPVRGVRLGENPRRFSAQGGTIASRGTDR
jgi:hypothetical protein